MNVIKPDNATAAEKQITVFLAGSIEMGSAPEWQTDVAEKFKDFEVTFFNPRRESWDSSWKQFQTETNFNQQVNWELNKLEESTFIFMNFTPDSKSPISLLELGYFAKSGKMIVCCPKEFWRVGNVEIMCTRNSIPLFYNIEDAIGALQTMLRSRE